MSYHALCSWLKGSKAEATWGLLLCLKDRKRSKTYFASVSHTDVDEILRFQAVSTKANSLVPFSPAKLHNIKSEGFAH